MAGRRLVMPVENLQGLESALPEQIRMYELVGRGTGIHFPALDADFYVRALIEGVYGNRAWMSELGRKGGSATSEAKSRPRGPTVPGEAQEAGCICGGGLTG